MKKYNTSYHVVSKCDSVSRDLLLESDEVDAVINYNEFEKIYLFGAENSGVRSTGAPQDYAKLRELHLRKKSLFLDENFSPNAAGMPEIEGNVVWKRPAEIVADPRFFVDGVSRFDINQGELGDCWFLASVANLTTNLKLFSMVVPPDQSFKSNYAGIFHFRFWQYGRWVDVVIDDRLPTINNQLIFLHSSDHREFWPALLEKAYAKLYGSYKNIVGGQISEGLEDLCGGLSENYPANYPYLFNIMDMSHVRSSFMGCSILSTEVEKKRTDGLVELHAYSVTNIIKILIDGSYLRLIRLRNPWGESTEWNGNWSDSSESWNQLPSEITKKLLDPKPDGEFWMEFSEFQQCFTSVDIVHLNPSAFSHGAHKNWIVNMFEGCWDHKTAGGGFKFTDTFSNNPQYFITIRGNSFDATYQVVIGLMQENRRVLNQVEQPLELNIFRIQSSGGKLLDKSFFKTENPVVSRSEVGCRQLTIRVELPIGRYCIVPSTCQPNVYGGYLLRIYSEVNANTRLLSSN